MKSWYLRLIELLILLFILANSLWFLLVYWVALFVLLEFLNRQPGYLSQKYHPVYNLLFVSYLIMVVWDRNRPVRADTLPEAILNIAEHLLLAWLVCFGVLQGLTAFSSGSRTRQVWGIALGFNVLGLLNEFYQNRMTDFPVFVLNRENLKDLSMNLLGTAVFLLWVLLFKPFSKPTA